VSGDLRINFTSNVREAAARFQVEVQSQVKAAAARAINRALTTARVEAVKLLRADYPGIKARVLRGRIKLVRATRGALAGALVFSGKRLAFYGNFPLRLVRTKYGTGIRVPGKLPYGLQTFDTEAVSREDLAHAFVQRARWHKRPMVWLRVGKRSMPIGGVVAEGAAAVFVERRIGQALERVVRARFQQVLEQEMKFRGSSAAS
jgi:hypothetical protein